MLKYLWRSSSRSVRPDETDPLRIRNLLDYPQLRAVMGTSLDVAPAARRPKPPPPDLSTFTPVIVLEGAA